MEVAEYGFHPKSIESHFGTSALRVFQKAHASMVSEEDQKFGGAAGMCLENHSWEIHLKNAYLQVPSPSDGRSDAWTLAPNLALATSGW